MEKIGDTNNFYEKVSKRTSEKLQTIAKGSKSKVLTELAADKKKETDVEFKANCRLADMVFHESMEMYREGDLTFTEMVEDLYKALKAIVK